MKILIDAACHVPEPRIVPAQNELNEDTILPPLPPIKGEHGPFFALFTTEDGIAGIEPEYAAELIASGEATLDTATAEEAIATLRRRARFGDDSRYWLPVSAQHRRDRIEREARAVEAFEEDESFYFDAETVGKILGVSSDTVIRNAGKGVIPAPVKIGRQYRFKKTAVLTLVAA